MTQSVTINNLEDIARAADEFLTKIADNKLIAFFIALQKILQQGA